MEWRFPGITFRIVKRAPRIVKNTPGLAALRAAGHRVGNGVTPVALSHHRTCGSAYGGSFNKLEALLSI